MTQQDEIIFFGVPLRVSLRRWLRVEAAQRDMRIQDLVDEIITEAMAQSRRGLR